MRKITTILTICIMAFSALMPFVIADDGEYVGTIEYVPGGSSSESIVAIWVTNETVGDDDHYKIGCQINPPGVFNQYVPVTFYAAIYHEDGTIIKDDDVKFDISMPNNEKRAGLGLGEWKQRDIKTVGPAVYAEYYAAHLLDSIPTNKPFICYRNEAMNGYEGKKNYTFLSWAAGEDLITFKKVTYDMYYHDPAGWYDMNVTLMTGSTWMWEKMYFEYVLALGLEMDNPIVAWDPVNENHKWYTAHGNWIWDENLRTIRNIGNWDIELGANFTHGTFDINNVLFDVRIGEATNVNNKFNQSYVEKYLPADHPNHGLGTPPIPSGMYPLIEYWGLPINNSVETGNHEYDDAFLKCHMAKIDFKIYPIQFNAFTGVYTFDIYLLWRLPAWNIVERHPCTGLEVSGPSPP